MNERDLLHVSITFKKALPVSEGHQTPRTWLIPLVLCILTIAIYLPVFNAEFINYDDRQILTQNPFVQNFDILILFTRPVATDYIPVTLTSFAVQNLFFGPHPWIYHTTNIFLHLCNIILCFYFLSALFPRRIIPSIAALFFAIHPINVEAVSWVSARKDVLFTFFYFLALLSYLKFFKSTSRKYYFLTALLFLLSIGSKPTAVTLPLLILLTGTTFQLTRFRKLLLDLSPFFLVSLLAGVQQYLIHDSHRYLVGWEFGRLLVPLESFGFYIRTFFFPINLSLAYDNIAISPILSGLTMVLSFFCLYAIAIWTKKYNEVLWMAGLFLIPLLPVLQMVPYTNNFTYANRYAYLSSAGFFCLIGLIFERLELHIRTPTIRLCILIIVLSISLDTHIEARRWRNSFSLWSHAVDHYPKSAIALSSLGLALEDIGNREKAIENYYLAIDANPAYPIPYRALANTFLKQNILDKAMTMANKAVELEPNSPHSHFVLAEVYRRVGNSAKAVEVLLPVVQGFPGEPLVQVAIAASYFDLELWEEGIRYFEISRKLNPRNAGISNSIGIGYIKLGQFSKAKLYFQEAVTFDPKHSEAAINLNWVTKNE